MTTTDWLTLALVLITGFYAWATFRILRANEAVVQGMKEQTEAQLRPYVVVAPAVRIGSTLISLEVQNTGKSHARNLRLTMDKDFYPHGELREAENIAKLPAFTQPIASFQPGGRLIFTLGVGGTIFAGSDKEKLCPKLFTVRARYEFGGKHYDEENVVDIHPMLHSAAPHDPVADAIRTVKKSIDKAATLK